MAPEWVLPTVILISFMVSLGIQLFNNKFTDAKFIKSKKKEMKELQAKMTPNLTKKELDDLQTRIMSANSELMKHMMKPTLYSYIPLLLVFWGLNTYFTPYGDLVNFPFSLPIFGPSISWLGTYILSSMIFSMTLKPLITKVSEKLNNKENNKE